MFDHLYLAQILMDELHCYRSFAHARRHALHRTMSHIAHRKNAGDIGFEQEWIAVERPTLGALSVTDKIGTGQKKTPLVALDQIAQPVGARQGSNKDEHRTRRHPFQLIAV